MGLLTELGKGQGYLRAGFLGFQSSGKTFTAITLAIGLHQHLKLTSRIAMFDTEGGSEYIAERVAKETGQKLLGVKSESFQDLMDMADECLKAGVGILVVDSVTHVWRELCGAYLAHVNEKLKAKGMFPRTKLEFQDWGPIKEKWAEWTRFFLNAPIHVIICGRAGFEYENELDEESGKRALIKVGTKMKTETEFGFEPSLLIEMERREIVDGKTGKSKVVHHAVINKDRFDVMDGMEFDDPTFQNFLPHISMLTPGANTPIAHTRTPMMVDEQGRSDWDRLKLRKQKAWEEVENGLAILFPGGTGKDKQSRLLIYQELAGTTSELKMQQLPVEQMERMALAIRTLGQDMLAGLVIENTPAYVLAIYQKLEQEELARMQSKPETVPPVQPIQDAMQMDRWLSEVLDCEDFLRQSTRGKEILQTIRAGMKMSGDQYPMLDEDRNLYHKSLKESVERLEGKAKAKVKVA